MQWCRLEDSGGNQDGDLTLPKALAAIAFSRSIFIIHEWKSNLTQCNDYQNVLFLFLESVSIRCMIYETQSAGNEYNEYAENIITSLNDSTDESKPGAHLRMAGPLTGTESVTFSYYRTYAISYGPCSPVSQPFVFN